MDRLEKSTSNNEDGFIKTVFPFDEEQKGMLLNIIQYAVLAIIPIVILLKMIKNYIPEAEDDKGSLVILVEVFGQVIIMFMALYFIHKIIEYIPTYSGFKYGEVNVFNIIPALLLISITMQTKLGEKVEILMDRLWELYEGRPSSNNQGKGGQGQGQGQGQVRVTQPLSQQYAPTVNTMPSTTTSIDALPNQLQGQQTNMKSQSNEYSIPQSPDFNSMYGGPETPLVGAANPGASMESFEPMAANDFLGGGGFGSSF